MNGAHVAARREPFDEAAYRASLRTLGLEPPVDRRAIRRAYRESAKGLHPDRFQDGDEKAQATIRIQEINAAHSYALQHWHGFHVLRRWDGAKWREWLSLPVTMVYALTTIAVALPFIALARSLGPQRRAAWGARLPVDLLWRFWLVLAPHVATIVLFRGVDALVLKAWIGISFLVMMSADIATLVTGEPHGLRRPLGKALDRLT